MFAEFLRLNDLIDGLAEVLNRCHVAMRVHRVLNTPANGRWNASRKEEVLSLIRREIITEAEACALYVISAEELAIWTAGFAAHGRDGLKVTKIQENNGTGHATVKRLICAAKKAASEQSV